MPSDDEEGAVEEDFGQTVVLTKRIKGVSGHELVFVVLHVCASTFLGQTVTVIKPYGSPVPWCLTCNMQVLRGYPEGTSVLKELLQNADDAGASVVRTCRCSVTACANLAVVHRHLFSALCPLNCFRWRAIYAAAAVDLHSARVPSSCGAA